MQSIPLILTPLPLRRTAVLRADAANQTDHVLGNANGPFKADAVPQGAGAGVGDVVAEGARHLGQLAKTIKALVIPYQQKQALLARLDDCRARFEALKSSVTQALLLERGTVRAWKGGNQRDKAMSARVVQVNIKVAAHCASLQQHLDELHVDIRPHLKDRNVARTVGLAIGALVGLAVAATLAVLLWPVVVGGAAVAGGFLLTGACAAAGGAAAGGIAAAALCVRELISSPEAYRNFPETQPDLTQLIKDIDSSLVQWLQNNADAVSPLDGAELLVLCGGDGKAAQAFCSSVHASSLSATVKSLVPVPDVSDARLQTNVPGLSQEADGDAGAALSDEDDSEAVPSREDIIDMLAEAMGLYDPAPSDASRASSEVQHDPHARTMEPNGSSAAVARTVSGSTGSRHSFTSEESAASATTMVMEDGADAPSLGEESEVLFADGDKQGGRVPQHPQAGSQPDESQSDLPEEPDLKTKTGTGPQPATDAPVPRLSQVWRDAVLEWHRTMAQVPEGAFDPAAHIEDEYEQAPPIDLKDPIAVDKAWRECVTAVESRLEFAQACLGILPADSAWWFREPSSIADVVIDRLARHQMLELLWGEASAVAELRHFRPDAFVVPETLLAFTSLLRCERKDAFRDNAHAIQQYLDLAGSVPFESLPQQSQEPARRQWQQLLARADELVEALARSWGALRYDPGRHAKLKDAALSILERDVSTAITRFQVEAKRRIKQQKVDINRII